MLISPTVFYAPQPKILMSTDNFLGYSNLTASIFGIISRLFASFKFFRLVNKVNFLLMLLLCSFLLYSYFTRFYESYEGIIYTYIVLVGLCKWCTGGGISYFNLCARKQATDDNRQAIGALMTNALFSGIALGNILSLPIPYIRSTFFE